MNVVPAPATPSVAAAVPSTACPSCGATLAADQRYCLKCGRPCSPVRLQFLDVLQSESAAGLRAPQATGQALGFPASYSPVLPPGTPPGTVRTAYAHEPEPEGMLGRLRRYSGVIALLGVLLLAGLIGLLVGHWASGSHGAQIVKLEGQLVAPAAGTAAATTPGTTATDTHPTSAKNSGSQQQSVGEEEKEVKEAETSKPLPAPVKAPAAIKKLSETHGKRHQQEIAKLIEKNPEAPIETG